MYLEIVEMEGGIWEIDCWLLSFGFADLNTLIRLVFSYPGTPLLYLYTLLVFLIK